MAQKNEPIRLKVTYKTPQALLTEFTRSVGTGSVTIESRKEAPVGTRFVFELRAQGVEMPLEVHGEVVQVAPGQHGRCLLTVRYDPGTDRKGLDELLKRIFETHRFEKVRRHVRIPIQLRATEDAPDSPSYKVRDISLGGVGMEIEAPHVPPHVAVGTPFLLEVTLSLGKLALHGEVVWVVTPPPDRAAVLNPTFGVKFGKLRADTLEHLQRILELKGLPPPPWRARVSFGMDAVGRMP